MGIVDVVGSPGFLTTIYAPLENPGVIVWAKYTDSSEDNGDIEIKPIQTHSGDCGHEAHVVKV